MHCHATMGVTSRAIQLVARLAIGLVCKLQFVQHKGICKQDRGHGDMGIGA